MKARHQLFAFTLLLTAMVSSFGQPAITVQPKSLTASLFADLTFRVTASSTQALSFQWRFNALPIDGAITNSLTITNVQKDNAGPFDVVVSDPNGSVTSKVATLTITPFNSIYCFGFSWTDTRGVGCNWPPPQYYKGRACNGPMWPEFLSTNLGLAYVPGNNYAHCGATTANIRDQVTSFPVPLKPQLSAYFVWLGFDIDVTDPESTWSQKIQNIIVNNSNTVAGLYSKGAREIVVETQFGDPETPGTADWCRTNTALCLRFHQAEAELLNAGCMDALNKFNQSKPDLRIVFVDMFSKFDAVLANATQCGFTKTDIDALHDLTDQSFTGPGADYVFWDPNHGTTKLHKLIAAWHLEVLTNSILEKLDVTITGGLPSIQMNHLLIGRDYTLQGSPDLSNWQDLQSFTATAGTNQWPGTADGATAAFYRLEWQP